jgi:hypothetical protein
MARLQQLAHASSIADDDAVALSRSPVSFGDDVGIAGHLHNRFRALPLA